MTVHAREFNSADDLLAHYKALKQRQRAAYPIREVVALALPALEIEPVVTVTPQPELATKTLYAWPIGPRHERDVLYIATQLEGVRKNARHIIDEVATKHGFKADHLKSAWRGAKVSRARMECYYRLRIETLLSLPQIGKLLGDRDHTSVLHGVKKWARLLEEGHVQ